MKKALIISAIIGFLGMNIYLLISYLKIRKKIGKAITVSMEYAYFEGQKDALGGEIRIKKGKSGWEWVKSPWDDTKAPAVYNPKLGVEENVRFSLNIRK